MKRILGLIAVSTLLAGCAQSDPFPEVKPDQLYLRLAQATNVPEGQCNRLVQGAFRVEDRTLEKIEVQLEYAYSRKGGFSRRSGELTLDLAPTKWDDIKMAEALLFSENVPSSCSNVDLKFSEKRCTFNEGASRKNCPSDTWAWLQGFKMVEVAAKDKTPR